MSDFKISRGHGRCAVTGHEFADGEKYIVALRPEGEQEGVFQRVDICMEAWERQGEEGYVAWWPTEYSSKRKPALLDPDALWEVFHKARRKKGEEPTQAEEDAEPDAGPAEEFSREDLDRFAYVAALGLMRLKKLKLKGTRRSRKREYLVFETPGRAGQRESFEVLNPELDEAGVEQIQDRLADLA
ncbi:MAG: hypothetical protein KDB82_05215 [Planctomycetes bacterium]|nr:hypothetical protein [Planctomycetota bacterium]